MREPERISSRDNRRLIGVRSVRDGRAKEQIFIEGKRLAREAIRSGLPIADCFLVEGFSDAELGGEAAMRADRVFVLPEKLFRTIVDTDQSQGIILLAGRPDSSQQTIESQLGASSVPIVILLKEINNPSNLGAILRTAEAAGVAGVIISRNSADAFSAKALRAAMGASFRIAIWDQADVGAVVDWAKRLGMAVAAADTSATRSYLDADWTIPRLLLFGSEAHGLTVSDMERLDDRVTIPLENHVESLNLAVSAGVLLFEAKRQNDLARRLTAISDSN